MYEVEDKPVPLGCQCLIYLACLLSVAACIYFIYRPPTIDDITPQPRPANKQTVVPQTR